MPDDYFGIGTTVDTITDLRELMTPLLETAAPVKSDYIKYPVMKLLGDGTTRGQGFPQASWLFTVIPLAERNELRTFCTGASENVYIRTKKDDDTFANFQAVMTWPKDDTDRWYGDRKNLLIQFVHLIEIPDAS
jgi:hypothetical protein